MAAVLRPGHHQHDNDDDDDDSDAERGTPSLFSRRAAVHHHSPTTYGSTAGPSETGSQPSEGPSVGADDPSSDVHVNTRRHRNRRGRRAPRQPNVEDV